MPTTIHVAKIRLNIHRLFRKVCCGVHNAVQYNLCKTATLKKTENWFQDQLSLNAGQKYCRMLQWHPAILLTFIKLPLVIKFCLFLNGRFTQVLLFSDDTITSFLDSSSVHRTSGTHTHCILSLFTHKLIICNC